jgi:hypothetical protein
MKQDTLPHLFGPVPEAESRLELASGAVLLRGFALDVGRISSLRLKASLLKPPSATW